MISQSALLCIFVVGGKFYWSLFQVDLMHGGERCTELEEYCVQSLHEGTSLIALASDGTATFKTSFISYNNETFTSMGLS